MAAVAECAEERGSGGVVQADAGSGVVEGTVKR